MRRFVVEGVDLNDGSRCELASYETSGEARDWLARYTRRLDEDGGAGGWRLIEVYDISTPDDDDSDSTDDESSERIAVWEAAT